MPVTWRLEQAAESMAQHSSHTRLDPAQQGLPSVLNSWPLYTVIMDGVRTIGQVDPRSTHLQHNLVGEKEGGGG